MGIVDTAKLLKSLEDAWEESEAKTVKVATIPDGTYQGYLRSATVELSKNGNLQVHWVLECVDGNYAGKKVHKFDRLDNAGNLAWLKGTMSAVGMKIPPKAVQLPKALSSFFEENGVDTIVNFIVKTTPNPRGNDFVNIYINGRISSSKEKNKNSFDIDSSFDVNDDTSY